MSMHFRPYQFAKIIQIHSKAIVCVKFIFFFVAFNCVSAFKLNATRVYLDLEKSEEIAVQKARIKTNGSNKNKNALRINFKVM